MKTKYLLFSILTIFSILSCRKEVPTDYNIIGQLNHNNNVSKIFLIKERIDSLGWYIQDTISVTTDGKFSFHEKLDTMCIASIIVDNNLRSNQFIIDKSQTININGDFAYPEFWQITGSEENNKINEFYTSIENDIRDIQKAKESLTKIDNDSLNDLNSFSDTKNKELDLSNKVSAYIKENPTDLSSVLIINRFLKNNASIERLSDALKLLKGKNLDFSLTDNLLDFENFSRSFSKGATAPFIDTEDFDNKQFRLTELRNQFVLLAFASSEYGGFDKAYTDINKEYLKLKPGKTIKTTKNNRTFDEKVLYNVKFVIIVKDIKEFPIDTKKLNKDIIYVPAYDGWSNQIFIEYNINKTPYSVFVNTYGRIEEVDFDLSQIKSTLDNLPRGLKEIPKK